MRDENAQKINKDLKFQDSNDENSNSQIPQAPFKNKSAYKRLHEKNPIMLTHPKILR